MGRDPLIDTRPELVVGTALRRGREEAGLSLRELARRLQRSHSNLWDYERGHRLAPAEVVRDYEDELGLHRASLLDVWERARQELFGDDRTRRRPFVAKVTVDSERDHRPALRSDLRWRGRDDEPRFVGRAHEVATIASMCDDDAAGARMVLVTGSSGMGKTRLAGEVAAEVDRRGALVLFGRCEDGAVRPFQPFAEALDHLAGALPDDVLAAVSGPLAPLLGLLSVPFASRLGELTPPVATGDSDRYRLFESVRSVLAELSNVRPVWFVIDDLHRADEPTLLLLRHMLRSLDPAALTIVATAQDDLPEQRRIIRELAQELGHDARLERCPLSGLRRDDVDTLIGSEHPSVSAGGFVEQLWQATQGNPLFVVHLARQLAEDLATSPDQRPGGAVLDKVVRDPPVLVRELLERRLLTLDESTSRLLAIAAVSGDEFQLQVVATVAGVPDDVAVNAVSQLLEHRVVVSRGGDAYRFAHELWRRAATTRLSPSQRVRVHRSVGRALLAQVPDDLTPVLGELAHHFGEAARLGRHDAAVALLAARLAAEQELGGLAYEAAATHFERALGFAKMLRPPDPSLAAELHLRLGETLNRAGRTEEAKRAFSCAFDLASRCGASVVAVRASLGYGGAVPLASNVDDSRAVQMLEHDLRAVGTADSPESVLCRSRLAVWLYRSGSQDRRRQLCEDAVAAARRLGDPRVLAEALHDRCWALFGPDDPRERLTDGDEIISIGRALRDDELVLHGLQCRMHALLEVGPAIDARRTGAWVRAYATDLRHPAHMWSSTVYGALTAGLAGEFETAERLSEDALRIHLDSHQRQAFTAYGTQRFQRNWLQGRLDEDRDVVAALARKEPDRPAFLSALAWIEAETGHPDKSRALLTRLAASGWAGLPKDLEWWPIVVGAVMSAHALGERDIARELYGLVAPYRAHNCVTAGVAFFGNAEHMLGLLAETLGDDPDAVTHLHRALSRYEEWDAPAYAAVARADLGRVLDNDRQIEASLRVARELGLGVILRRGPTGREGT
jgi:transcriptional regulator with XRE-family HTH domain